MTRNRAVSSSIIGCGPGSISTIDHRSERGHETCPNHGRLPAAARADDGQEPIRGEAADQLLGERFPAEERSSVGLLERKESLVRVRDRQTGRGGHRALGTGAKRPLEREIERGIPALAPELDHADGLGQTLEGGRATIDLRHAIDPPGEMHHLTGREDLPGTGDGAEPRGEVQRPTTEPTFDRHRLPRVEPDPDRER